MIFIDATKIDDRELSLVVQFIKKLVFQYVKFSYCFRFTFILIVLNVLSWASHELPLCFDVIVRCLKLHLNI